jgi:hypothetical protein
VYLASSTTAASTQTYINNASSIYVEKGENITVRNCIGRNKRIGWPSSAYVEVLQRDKFWQCVGRNVGATNLDYGARFVPVVQDRPSPGTVAVNDRQLICRPGDAPNGDGGCQ